MEAHIVATGLPEYPRDVIMSIDDREAKPIKIFSHYGDGVYIYCSEHEAEEIAVTLLAMVQTVRERKALKEVRVSVRS